MIDMLFKIRLETLNVYIPHSNSSCSLCLGREVDFDLKSKRF